LELGAKTGFEVKSRGPKKVKNLAKRFVMFMVLAVHDLANAQLDRAGNAIDDGGSGGAGVVGVLSWGVIGALVGSAYGWFKNSQSEKKIAIDGCAVIGGLIGMFVSPLLAMLLK
jgi:hypothetical protein